MPSSFWPWDPIATRQDDRAACNCETHSSSAGTGRVSSRRADGIFIEGWGIAVDAVVADFIAGAAEQLVLQAPRTTTSCSWKAGQPDSSRIFGRHPRLLHGSCPDALILAIK